MKKLLKLFMILIILSGISIVGGKYYFDDQIKAVNTNGNIHKKEIEIPSGSSTETIAKILKNNNLIKNEIMFRILAKIEGKEGKLKAGYYKLDTGMEANEILNELIEGGYSKNTITFTIPEGFVISQIANRLQSLNLIDKNKFISLTKNTQKFSDDYKFLESIPKDLSMEGYLYPDTYEVYKSDNEETIIKKMLDRFQKVYNEEIKDENLKEDLNVHDIITIASLIEKETKLDKERKLVSAVIYNRLKKGMLLQIDATIQYSLKNRKERLTYNDLEVESQYNTYKEKGLPPGPIGAPGVKSIVAALNPADKNYIYYILKKDSISEHFFTDDYNEFLRVKNQR